MQQNGECGERFLGRMSQMRPVPRLPSWMRAGDDRAGQRAGDLVGRQAPLPGGWQGSRGWSSVQERVLGAVQRGLPQALTRAPRMLVAPVGTTVRPTDPVAGHVRAKGQNRDQQRLRHGSSQLDDRPPGPYLAAS